MTPTYFPAYTPEYKPDLAYLQTSLFQNRSRNFPQIHLADFSAARNGNCSVNPFLAKDKNVLWCFVPAEGLSGPCSELFVRWSFLCLCLCICLVAFVTSVGTCKGAEGSNDFAVFLIWDADHGGYLDCWVGR